LVSDIVFGREAFRTRFAAVMGSRHPDQLLEPIRASDGSLARAASRGTAATGIEKNQEKTPEALVPGLPPAIPSGIAMIRARPSSIVWFGKARRLAVAHTAVARLATMLLAGLIVVACGDRGERGGNAQRGGNVQHGGNVQRGGDVQRGGAATAPAAPPTRPSERWAGFTPARDWPIPASWRSETLPFPLEFAPQLAHQGSEELRFAPGMFDPSAADYWSYAFVWWLEDRQLQDAAALSGELAVYFRGLLVSVDSARSATAGGTAISFDPSEISCSLRADGQRDHWQQLRGEAVVFDAFGDGRKLTLHLRLWQGDLPAAGRRAVIVLASPADRAQPIWRQLESVAASFAPATR
jgi:hypothetical protein